MTVWGLLFLCGGLGVFLLGMKILSHSLHDFAGTAIRSRLSDAASYPIRGLFYGAVVTAILQSSSALTVFLVGLTGAGIMSLESAAVLLMGANVGTTLSPWVLGLLGLSHSTPLLRPEYICPLLALLGMGFCVSKRKRRLGQLLLGMSLLLWGMKLMQKAALYMPGLPQLSPTASHPLQGVLMGTVVTGILQSSAGAVGMLQALCLSGELTIGGVIPLLIGLNLGTCVTALLASLGGNFNARRVAVIHISFNALGGIVWLTALWGCSYFKLLCQPASPISVAVLHSLFNLSTAAILLPLRTYLVHLASIVIPEKSLQKRPLPPHHSE